MMYQGALVWGLYLLLGLVREVGGLVCKLTLHSIEFEISNIFAGQSEADDDDFWTCQLVIDGELDDLMYDIDIDESLLGIDELEFEDELVDEFFLDIPDGFIDEEVDQVMIPHPSSVEVIDSPLSGRRLSRATMGDLTALVIRVSTPDAEPTRDAAKMYEVIFEDDMSLRHQVQRCSFGKLNIEPTKWGVVDVKVPVNAQGSSYAKLVNEAYTVLLEDVKSYGVSKVSTMADFIMVVLPPGTIGDWKAYGSVGGQSSTYNDKWANRVSVQIHEIGHNLGLNHAHYNGNKYGDTTGYLGLSSSRIGYPARCFNGQNSWKLGWYGDRATRVDPEQPQLYSVAAFVDYDKMGNDDYAVLRVDDLYLQYNRQKDFNRETGKFSDSLTIVKQISGGTDLLDGLNGRNPVFQQKMSGITLVIELCGTMMASDTDQPDRLTVSVGYDKSLCKEFAPTRAPGSPTPVPYEIDSLSPQERPSVAPKPHKRPFEDETDDNLDTLLNGAQESEGSLPRRSKAAIISIAVVLLVISCLLLLCLWQRRRERYYREKVSISKHSIEVKAPPHLLRRLESARDTESSVSSHTSSDDGELLRSSPSCRKEEYRAHGLQERFGEGNWGFWASVEPHTPVPAVPVPLPRATGRASGTTSTCLGTVNAYLEDEDLMRRRVAQVLTRHYREDPLQQPDPIHERVARVLGEDRYSTYHDYEDSR